MADRSHVESFSSGLISERSFEVTAPQFPGDGGPFLWRFPRIARFAGVFAAREEVKWTEAEAQRDADGEINASQRKKKNQTAGSTLR